MKQSYFQHYKSSFATAQNQQKVGHSDSLFVALSKASEGFFKCAIPGIFFIYFRLFK